MSFILDNYIKMHELTETNPLNFNSLMRHVFKFKKIIKNNSNYIF